MRPYCVLRNIQEIRKIQKNTTTRVDEKKKQTALGLDLVINPTVIENIILLILLILLIKKLLNGSLIDELKGWLAVTIWRDTSS